jgi:hypothetical protein
MDGPSTAPGAARKAAGLLVDAATERAAEPTR